MSSERCNVALGGLARSPLLLARRGLRYARAWAKMASCALHPRKTLYLVSEGDRLLIMTLITVSLARLFQYRVVLQHRSFAYINKRSSLMAAVNRVMGREACHVFLTDGMAAKYFRHYQPTRDYVVNHNIAQSRGSGAPRGGHPVLAGRRKTPWSQDCCRTS